MTRRSVLFIAPAFPARRGIGPALRARLFLDALCGDFDVHLVVIPLVGLQPSRGQLEELSDRCARVDILPPGQFEDPAYLAAARLTDDGERTRALASYRWPALGRFARPDAAATLATTLAGRTFDLAHVSRLYVAPLLAAVTAGSTKPRLQLDLDDYESRTHASLAALLDERGIPDAAALETAESQKYAWWEDAFLPRFERVFVCSERDRAALAARFPFTRVAVVPNAVDVPPAEKTAPVRSSASPYTFLFVGSLGYLPNQDAIEWFCGSVLPLLRARSPSPVRLAVAGPHAPWAPGSLGADVTIAGWVDDLAAEYRRADAVLAPIRAGGGTRIKVLEALAHRRPLVATPAAVDGVEVEPDEHYLAGFDAESLAAACLTLIERPEDASAMIERAYRLVRARHETVRVREAIRELCAI